MRILLVEDDEDIGDAVRDHVAMEGHAVDWATSLTEARQYLSVVNYDQLLLDLSLPDGDGLTLLTGLRQGDTAAGDAIGTHRCGVLVLTARDRLSDRIVGLDSGADDYLVKPFDLDELVARMRALARRRETIPERVVVAGRATIDLRSRRAICVDEPVELTSREWCLVERLARRPGATVSRRDLENTLYESSREVETNALDALVSRTRRKLGREAITTVRGLGYRLDVTHAP